MFTNNNLLDGFIFAIASILYFKFWNWIKIDLIKKHQNDSVPFDLQSRAIRSWMIIIVLAFISIVSFIRFSLQK